MADSSTDTSLPDDSRQDWADGIFDVLKSFELTQASYVPDGGHVRLIERFQADESIAAISLTTEEEGVAQSAGAWLGGARSVLLMQSSGVGNCINMLSLIKHCKFPFLTLITMRGEWGEFNPWQVPMGSVVGDCLSLMGVTVMRADRPEEVVQTVRSAASMAFLGGTPCAVLLSQSLIGAKDFTK
ncbi:phosphonopyruvate decarboxylase [Pelagibius sp. Alg239-R121]|uniref:phosphonopyruvate decarboxylase n=1 Tax=Pelagibius sp. Alg239-R121 TaxID=2993448 RepID=UPI0024A69E8B|nr:phosphonopyruvate decarboxylase [Pelagibius sp. Alg239-R121]